ncbi:MAG: biopolymer transporter ExbD [Candidatus Cloacimonadaceae bacterium]|jgi:biopolymer transport protein ExbD|nr:biopolymer transporter ExbD [Candidatus Cloacimonadota bacterium]MDX9950099.1 biopolymer transporter ExbD [Candidatus Syntrophosphaera sp.]NLN85103.1 biopolymer transporter ExbD [Candidatus Cloacimonadota bacterium]
MSHLMKSKTLNRKVRRKFPESSGLSIISLVDILTILLVFLMKNVSMEVQKHTMPNNMTFPVTMEKRDLLENKGTTLVQIYPDRILLGEQGIYFGTLQEFASDQNKREAIFNYLQNTALEILADKDDDGNPKTPTALLIQADKSIPCWYITEFVSLGTSSFHDYIYFATLLETDWLEKSKSITSG